MSYAAEGNRNTALRIIEAERAFLINLQEFGGITETEARKVFESYRRSKVIKLDPVGGRWHVKHGAYFDRAVIREAAGL